MFSGFRSVGSAINDRVRRWLPDPFVFALALTVLVAAMAIALTPTKPVEVMQAWYQGFWILLEFGMQMVLILATGYAIALSPAASGLVDRVAKRANTPTRVYFVVVLVGGLLSLISWGWVVLTAVLGRELAQRVRGLDYAFLTACVYVSGQPWVGGFSSSIPLLLGTENNFMVEQGVLSSTLPIATTLGSSVNILFLVMFFTVTPLLMTLLQPDSSRVQEMEALTTDGKAEHTTVAEEAGEDREDTLSDRLNHSQWLSLVVVLAGLGYVTWHFATKGFDLNLNIMVFLFIMVGLLVHRTPMRYVVAMKRACSNISGIVLQYPFYAGIMGIMMFTGLGTAIAGWMAGVANLNTLPFLAQLSGAAVNFAIPSAGGEWAVIGPSLVEASHNLTVGLPDTVAQGHIARIAMAFAYGETSSNLIQPFFFLVVLPIMGAGVKLQARDVIGYLVIPFLVLFALTSVVVTWAPL